jgi:hypothetical protein
MSKATERESMVVTGVVEFEVDRDEVSESELVSGLMGELVKVKSGVYENQFYGNIISVQTKEETAELERAFEHIVADSKVTLAELEAENVLKNLRWDRMRTLRAALETVDKLRKPKP